MTAKEILAENYDQIKGICERLPIGLGYAVHADGSTMYASEADLRLIATGHGQAKEFDEAKAKKLRGQRLVVIVTPTETLYQYV